MTLQSRTDTNAVRHGASPLKRSAKKMPEMSDRIKVTPKEAELLKQRLDFYLDLESGDHKPTTKKQGHFVAVAQGRSQANTIDEIAFGKYKRQRVIERGKREKEQDEEQKAIIEKVNLRAAHKKAMLERAAIKKAEQAVGGSRDDR